VALAASATWPLTRQHSCAMTETGMRNARWKPLLLVALAALASACGASTKDDGASGSLQGNLRALAAGAPAGDRAYWLGPAFHAAPVSFANGSWGRFALLTYHEVSNVDLDVETFPSATATGSKGFRIPIRTHTGQDVVVIFRSPARPSAALVRAVHRELRPIPLHVSVPG
jgi:hypothetical protein